MTQEEQKAADAAAKQWAFEQGLNGKIMPEVHFQEGASWGIHYARANPPDHSGHSSFGVFLNAMNAEANKSAFHVASADSAKRIAELEGDLQLSRFDEFHTAISFVEWVVAKDPNFIMGSWIQSDTNEMIAGSTKDLYELFRKETGR